MRRLTSSSCLAALLVLAATGCAWRKIEEQHQMEARSYVRPVGNTAGATVTLTGKRTYNFVIGQRTTSDSPRYAVDPGNYRVTVQRGGQIVLDRMLLLADGETRELRVQ